LHRRNKPDPHKDLRARALLERAEADPEPVRVSAALSWVRSSTGSVAASRVSSRVAGICARRVPGYGQGRARSWIGSARLFKDVEKIGK
jgi:hypothetical protein